MNREKIILAGVFVAVILVGGGILFHSLFLAPLSQKDDNITSVRSQIDERKERIALVNAERPLLAQWRELSLPKDADLARREYQKYLDEALQKAGFTAGYKVIARDPENKSAVPNSPGGPDVTVLAFSVEGDGELTAIVKMLERFYRTPLLHEIRQISIKRIENSKPGEPASGLHLSMVVEALILQGAEDRRYLLPGIDKRILAEDVYVTMMGGPGALALIPWALGTTGPANPGRLAKAARQYTAVASKDVFTGMPPADGPEPDMASFVFLVGITLNDNGCEAALYNNQTKAKMRLCLQAGKDTFRVMKESGELRVQGKVVRIENREVFFSSEKKYYAIRLGQNLEEAMRSPLPENRVKELRLVVASAPKPGH
jgi:hypothetical protein